MCIYIYIYREREISLNAGSRVRRAAKLRTWEGLGPPPPVAPPPPALPSKSVAEGLGRLRE